MIGTTISHYRVTAELGSGGMGVVYQAEDLRLGRHVALKFLPEALSSNPQALERFQREARAASSLNHRHICTIHEIDEQDGQPFIVMELLEGQTLRQRIAVRRFDLEGVLEMSMQIAEGLEAAHAKGIIHRDIKSANVFVTDAGQAKILDFGLAKLAADRPGEAEAAATALPTVASPGGLVTGPGQTMGTVAYMSPEQVRGEELDARTDIFSCGVVIYEMATGTLPFQGATSGLIFDGILNKAPIPASQQNAAIPIELDRILDKALEKDRELRYQSARDLRADLTRLRRDSGSLRSTAGVPAAPAPSRSRRRALVAALVGVVAVTLAAIGYLAWPGREPAVSSAPRTLSRVTFDDGLQAQPTWSPDSRFIAYSSNQSGNFDIWVQPLGGGRAVQVTTDPAHDWQPVWSPDGNSIAFRSEREGGGIFLVPALGGRERKLAPFGYWPEWSPDGSQILFVIRPTLENASLVIPHVYVVGLNGAPPTRILAETLATFRTVQRMSWHPDGQRVSFMGVRGQQYGFWTVPVSGGEPVLSEVAEVVLRNLKELSLGQLALHWSATGDSLYFEGASKGIRNLWVAGVDRQTLRWVSGPDRLTTGLGIDSDIALSRDGNKLAFVTKSETSRLWSLPFDAKTHRVTADGQVLTAANASVASFDLTPDGKRLVFVVRRPGKDLTELWSRSFDDGREAIVGEAPGYFTPRLSKDGTHVAYRFDRVTERVERAMSWIALAGGAEHAMPQGLGNVWDWSADGERILHSCAPPERLPTLCWSPRDASTTAEIHPLIVDPGYSIWQGRFSPDGRWVSFNAQSVTAAGISIIGVAPAAGGKWIPLTEASLWADKPRWAPDGSAIYFISNRDGAFFDLWGIRFDTTTGQPIGEAFRVTHYDNPGRIISASGAAEIGVSGTRLVLPITETSGSVWVLDHLKR